jgi:hypothetical protein
MRLLVGPSPVQPQCQFKASCFRVVQRIEMVHALAFARILRQADVYPSVYSGVNANIALRALAVHTATTKSLAYGRRFLDPIPVIDPRE